MAAIQFPAAPTNPETVVLNGVAYTWNGSFWEANTQNSDFDDRYVERSGDDMSGNLTLGTDKIELDATDGDANFEGNITAAGNVDVAGEITAAGEIKAEGDSSGGGARFRGGI